MKTRLDLHYLLVRFQAALGEMPHVYYQPPSNITMTYPCFVYDYSDNVRSFANNNPYKSVDEYVVKYITKDPVPTMVDGLMKLAGFRFDRHYTGDGLHHFSFVVTMNRKSEEIVSKDGTVVDFKEVFLEELGGSHA